MSLTVIGLGSELAGDDAIGLILVEQVAGRLGGAPTTCVQWPDADALTVANDLLALETDVLLVDCADMGLAPGSARLLAAGEVRVHVKHSPVSVHGLGIAEALELARRLGFHRQVHFFAVQPYGLAPGAPLTAALAERVPELVAELERAARELLGDAPRGGGTA
jgi:hydrogenase maturation protease